MGTYKVNLSERAGRDILGIITYITRQLQAPEAAQNIAELIDAAINRLMEMPERYAILANERLKVKGIRRVPVENYLIFFTIDKRRKIVSIITVQYNRRDWASHL